MCLNVIPIRIDLAGFCQSSGKISHFSEVAQPGDLHYQYILNRNGHLVLRRQKFCHSCPVKASHARTAKHGMVPRQTGESFPRDKGPTSGTVCELDPGLLIMSQQSQDCQA